MGDLEKAKREIRYARSAAEDRRWDLLETRIRGIEAALEGVSESESAPVLAEIAPLRESMAKALREEQASRIEREIKRNLANAEDGSEAQLEKALLRLQQPDAQECLAPESVQRLQQEMARIGGKLGVAVAAPAAPTQAKPAAAAPAPAPATLSDEGRAIESDVARLLRFAEEDVERAPEQAESRIERALARLDSEEAKRHLPPQALEHLKALTAGLQAKIAAGRQAEAIARIEEQIVRFTRQCESDFQRGAHSAGDMLRRAAGRLASEDAKRLLPAATAQRLRTEIEQLGARIAETRRRNALERALPILQELEARAAGNFLQNAQPAWRVLGDLDYEKSRVRGAIDFLPAADAEVRAIETRLAALDERIAGACAALDAEQARARVGEAWRLECEAIAGWEEEQAEADGAVALPKTTLAVHRLSHFLADAELARIRSAHSADGEIEAAFTQAARTRDAAVQKLNAAFEAVLGALEAGARPANRIDLEAPARLAAQARSALAGTQYAESNAASATALDARWQAEIAADRAAREAKYRELSAVADAAWPGIAATIRAEESFDPQEEGARGKTVRLNGIRNRIGWDFSGPYDFAMWVNDTPVVGNYEKTLAAAVDEACERTGLPLDDHTDWDVVLVVGGPGKIKQRFRVLVRDRNMREIGTIEEWRPVDCVMCSVIALRAGPVAAGPPR